ncbi:MAG: hypothetical protein FJ390_06810, partial [Verrucomicrobia bacterium]|nr:hypothetical protein [Verrucomicrobiota bacterium]
MPSLQKPNFKKRITDANFHEWLATTRDCCNVVFFAVDLKPYDEELAALSHATHHQESAIFLGCHIGPRLAHLLTHHHAIVFPEIPGKPYQLYRKSLYSIEELFAGYSAEVPESYHKTLYWRIYLDKKEVANDERNFFSLPLTALSTEEHFARSLHDHFIQEQLYLYLENLKHPRHRGIVGFMGGHRVLRSSSIYFEVATLCRRLTRDGFLIASGGGEGLMEAANLGAWLAPLPDEELKKTIAMLSIDGANSSSDPLWLSTAWNVRNKTLHADLKLRRSLGIFTWQFEQQNIFATNIACFFDYELREKTLIAIAKQGLIYGPGSVGTFEEIFRTAYQNHYTKSKYC